MAANLTTHGPILFAQSFSQKGPFSGALPERAGQSFLAGTPVQLYTSGSNKYTQAWDGVTVANGILGVSLCNGSNLASNGAGAPSGYGPVGSPRAIQSYGSVPNQPSAINLAIGTPVTDGRTLYQLADGDTIFEAFYDNSTGAVAADYTPNGSQIGSTFGLTKDANGYWYVDGGVTGANAVVEIVGANPVYGFGQVNGRVRFTFIASARALSSTI